jgi:hypothetical protein
LALALAMAGVAALRKQTMRRELPDPVDRTRILTHRILKYR